MAATVNLPPGCYGISLDDGTAYNADRRGRIEVSDTHAGQIRRSWTGQAGVATVGAPLRIATRTTRWCRACVPNRAWQAWTLTCPRCGGPTTE